jgi:hypothetical protein
MPYSKFAFNIIGIQIRSSSLHVRDRLFLNLSTLATLGVIYKYRRFVFLPWNIYSWIAGEEVGRLNMQLMYFHGPAQSGFA